MAMTPLERKAAFKAAVTLRQVTMAQAAAAMGVSYNHLLLVLGGERVGSERLERAIADFVGRAPTEMFERRRPATGGQAKRATP
jgi:hypothetical protein